MEPIQKPALKKIHNNNNEENNNGQETTVIDCLYIS